MMHPMMLIVGVGTTVKKYFQKRNMIIYFSGKTNSVYKDQNGFEYWVDILFLKYIS